MLKEAARVLKKGGKFGFSVWGSRENSKLDSEIFPKIIQKYNLPTGNGKSNFHISDNLDQFRIDLKNHGFSDFIFLSQFCPYDLLEKKDFDIIEELTKGLRRNIQDEQLNQKVIQDLNKRAQDYITQNKEPLGLEILIVIGFKN